MSQLLIVFPMTRMSIDSLCLHHTTSLPPTPVTITVWQAMAMVGQTEMAALLKGCKLKSTTGFSFDQGLFPHLNVFLISISTT